jgi:hypothetical protein
MQFRSWARGEGELYSRKAARRRDARPGGLNRKRQRTGNDFTSPSKAHSAHPARPTMLRHFVVTWGLETVVAQRVWAPARNQVHSTYKSHFSHSQAGHYTLFRHGLQALWII